MRIISIFLLLFSIQPIFAQQGPPVEIPKAPISTGGGRIDLSTIPKLSELGLEKLFVDIPAGAVKAQVNIKIGVPTSIPIEKAAARAVEFTIEGHESRFNFEKPVTIGIPYPETVENETALTVMEWDPTSGEWNPVDMVETVVADTAANIISAKVTHFTIYGAVEEETPTSVEEDTKPVGFSLSQNYPNPFNPMTTITYGLMEASHVKISIYNVIGQHVRTLIDELKPAGSHSVKWDGKNEAGNPVTNGVYIYRMDAGNFTQSRKLLLIK